VVRMEKRIAYSLLVGQPEGKRTLGRSRRKSVDNIKMDLPEIGWSGGLHCSVSGWIQMESSCERGNELWGFRKMLGNYRVAAKLMSSRVALSSTELVI
jgi:hypothetical protein